MPTVANAVELYFQTEIDPRKRESTAAQYRDVLKRVRLPIAGQIMVNEIKAMEFPAVHFKLRETPVTSNILPHNVNLLCAGRVLQATANP